MKMQIAKGVTMMASELRTDSRLPVFANADEEAAYWEEHSTAPHWDGMEPSPIVVEAQRRPTKMISLRLPENYLSAVKRAADQKGIPYQSLMRMWLVERLQQEGML